MRLGGSDLTINVKEIEQLIKMMGEGNIAELEVEADGTRIAIRRQTSEARFPMASVPIGAAETAAPGAGLIPAAVSAHQIPETAQGAAGIPPNQVFITAPMVGTFYRAPAPDAAPYVQEGSVISVGQPLCIIEAMKLMNEIESEVAGRILGILAENGRPIEYGQPLFLVEKLG